VAIALVTGQRILTCRDALAAWLGGIQSMLMAVVILVLAWGLGGVTGALGTGPYLASLLQDTLPLTLLPGLVFIVAALTAFSTGTSWGTMAILFPVVIPLAVAMGAGVGFAGGEHYAILLGTISSVMAGAVFGDTFLADLGHDGPEFDGVVLRPGRPRAHAAPLRAGGGGRRRGPRRGRDPRRRRVDPPGLVDPDRRAS
jgi:hypothetical protein